VLFKFYNSIANYYLVLDRLYNFFFNTGLEINVYALKWEGNGIYLFGLVDKGILPSSENECGLFEDLYCIFKELEVCIILYLYLLINNL